MRLRALFLMQQKINKVLYSSYVIRIVDGGGLLLVSQHVLLKKTLSAFLQMKRLNIQKWLMVLNQHLNVLLHLKDVAKGDVFN